MPERSDRKFFSLTAFEFWSAFNPEVSGKKPSDYYTIAIGCPECYLPTWFSAPGYLTISDIKEYQKEHRKSSCSYGCHGWEMIEISKYERPDPSPQPKLDLQPTRGRRRLQSLPETPLANVS